MYLIRFILSLETDFDLRQTFTAVGIKTGLG